MRRFTVLFLVFILYVYGVKASNVTSYKISAKVTSYKFDIQDIQCYSLVCNHDNMVLITSNHGLLVFDGANWCSIPLSEHCKLIADNNNSVYIAGNTFVGRILFNADGFPSIEELAHFDAGQAWILPDSFYISNKQPTIRVGTKIYRLQGSKLVEVISASNDFPLREMEMEPGYTVHLRAGGTIEVTNNKLQTLIPVNANFNEDNLPVIGSVQDRNHSIWILFHDALKRLDLFSYSLLTHDLPFDKIIINQKNIFFQKKTQIKTLIQGLKKNRLLVDSIVTDRDGNLWVRGHKIIKDHAEIYVIPVSPKNNFQLLNIVYQNLGLTTISELIPLKDGNILFVGKEGRIVFNTRKFLNESRNFPLHIHKMTEDGSKIITEGFFGIENQHPLISVNSAVETVSFYFDGNDLRSGKPLLVSTYLEGHDTTWSDWKNIRSLSYGYLTSGDYCFHVRGMSDNGFISAPASVHFSVETSFYKRWWAWVIYSIFLVMVLTFYWLRRKRGFEKEKAKLEYILNERTAELMIEKAKTDDLLANLLPKDTADELKNTGKATSQKYNMVTVLFSDIQGFTKIAEEMNPEKLIDELDNFFFHFDSVVEKYNIEKIKTIGDAYMCAGGIPYKNRTNPVEVVLAALEMQNYMKQLRQKNVNIWDLRIGVHTGAVIAGVVGHKRVSYDIWGDTVNTASRMESSGEAGKVNISGQTYEMIKDFFICEYRGRMPVKYKGDIDMFFVKAIRPELSIDLKVIPNKSFFIQLQILRLQDLEEYILHKMTEELPPTVVFHNCRQTKDVYSVAELLGRAESLSAEDILLVRTAALFLNIGYTRNYKDHILNSIHVAETVLPKFKYTMEQILVVNQLINATNTRYNHTGKLESILIDAYNNYIGRVDFLILSIDLFHEVKQHNGGISEKEWFNQQVRFLEHFSFYTTTANILREVSAQEQILKIKEYAKID